MRRDFTIYRLADGMLLRGYVGHEPELQCGAGEAVTVGALDLLRQRIDLTTGQPVEYRPPKPEPGATWDEREWRWITKADRNAPLLAEIRALEARQDRAVREALLTGDRAVLATLEASIASLRAQLER